MRKPAVIFLFLALIASSANAQLTPSGSVVDFSAHQEKESYLPGESYRILFRLLVDEGWHTQSHTPSLDSLIPTILTLESTDGIAPGRILYPAGTMVKFDFSDVKLSSYEGEVFLGATLSVSEDLAPGDYTISAELQVQACNDKNCLAPSNIELIIPIKVEPARTAITTINGDLFARNSALFESSTVTETGEGGEIGGYFAEHGLWLTLIFVFLGGLALNLTPCVYPLIPITVSYFGGQSESKKGKLLLHSLLYLLGMAVTYSALGVLAALTGGMFGALLQHWAVIILIALVMVALALAMFGLYEITMPSALSDIGGKNRKGFFGTFMMGLTIGIIVAPCIGPFVLGLLTFVGEKQDPLLGFLLFFVLALGLGLPFVFLALFSGGVSYLPRSGMWMVWVKKVFGFILLGMALYFLEPLIPGAIYAIVTGLFLLSAGIYLGFVTQTKSDATAFKGVKIGVGLAFVALGIMLLLNTQSGDDSQIAWKKGDVESIGKAVASGQPLIIDFYADWCVPCKELDHYTFNDKRLAEFTGSFDAFKVDLTKSGEPVADELKERFNVIGVPTIVFIGKDGKERKDLRFVGYVDADKMLAKIRSLLDSERASQTRRRLRFIMKDQIS